MSLGQTVVLESSYEKVRDVSGVSHRYIECLNQNRVYVRYQLNEADADRRIGTGTTGIILKIPSEIPEVTLPTSCHFTMAIQYQVLPFRTVPETQASRHFTLVAALQPPLAGTCCCVNMRG